MSESAHKWIDGRRVAMWILILTSAGFVCLASVVYSRTSNEHSYTSKNQKNEIDFKTDLDSRMLEQVETQTPKF